jgi:hypothetical protein
MPEVVGVLTRKSRESFFVHLLLVFFNERYSYKAQLHPFIRLIIKGTPTPANRFSYLHDTRNNQARIQLLMQSRHRPMGQDKSSMTSRGTRPCFPHGYAALQTLITNTQNYTFISSSSSASSAAPSKLYLQSHPRSPSLSTRR